jgi:hypothetical protein
MGQLFQSTKNDGYQQKYAKHIEVLCAQKPTPAKKK